MRRTRFYNTYLRKYEQYGGNDNGSDEVLNLFERALDMNDVQLLDYLIFPGSPILTATSSFLKTTPLHLICESQFVNIDILQSLIDLGVNINAQTIEGITPLHSAVNFVKYSESFSNHIQAIQILLKRGASPYIKDENGLTPIQAALHLNELEVVEAFLKEADQLPNINKVDVSIRLQHLTKCLLKERSDWTASITNYSIFLHFLVLQNDEEMFDEELFEYVAKNTQFDANALNGEGFTLLHVVAEFGTPRCIKTLIDVGADPNFSFKYANSPIFSAIMENRTENIQTFLDCGASVNIIPNKYPHIENSPLHYAVSFQKFESVKILVENGADVNEVVDHRSPLQIACATSNFKIVEFLLSRGADVHGKNELGKTILDESCESGTFEIVQLLMSHGAKLNQGDVSTLHYAAIGGNSEIVRLLLEHGADVDYRCIPDKVNELICPVPRTAFEFAVMHGRDDSQCRNIIEIITEYEADVNLADPVRGETLLHLACFSNRLDSFRSSSFSNTAIIQCLLKCNANVNALDSRGLTPLHHALYNYSLMSISPDYWNLFKSALNVLVAFIAKMIVRRECVIEANLQLLKDRPILPIYEECVDEINCMRRNICDSLNFSFLSILTRDTDALGRALKNKDLSHFLHGGQYKKEFPIYAVDLEERIWEAELRHPKVELGTELFNKHVKDNFHDEFVEICKYLSLKDLDNFEKACERI